MTALVDHAARHLGSRKRLRGSSCASGEPRPRPDIRPTLARSRSRGRPGRASTRHHPALRRTAAAVRAVVRPEVARDYGPASAYARTAILARRKRQARLFTPVRGHHEELMERCTRAAGARAE